ncbi:MAG: uroporphyrinogen-III C-methyltransferase, partial [Pseudomonadales bacterium]
HKQAVGKRAGSESTGQETINDLLVRLAREGHRVLRLKGGDPFIFGRGGEEIETLAEHGIPFQVVPGITAATGCAAYAGIPLTHRDYSQSVRFVTGHPKDGEVNLEWQEFAHKNQTIVFYMGLGGLEKICTNLKAHGRAPDTPVAIISKGTTPEQQVVVGTLDSIVSLVRAHDIKRPTLIIVGEVVKLYEILGGKH